MSRSRIVGVALLLGCGLTAYVFEESGITVMASPGRVGGTGTWTHSDHRPHAGMLRYADVSADDIAFVYANDIWLVSRDGGVATPLSSPPGPESYPQFSDDGETIAFVGNYDGNRDLYTISKRGGIPHRVTHHPSAERLCGWTPDGQLLFHAAGFAGLRRQAQLFTVSATGGLPARVAVPYGTDGAMSPDGRWLAYTPNSRLGRTWKRYRGGMATDIWLFNLHTHESRKITEWEGTDALPMWHGNVVYYLSDGGPEHRFNIWSYDLARGGRRQITHMKDFDVNWPAIGPGRNGGGEIVFQHGSDLYLLDLETENGRTVEVTVPGDRPVIRPISVDASKFIRGGDVSSTGKRAVAEARGDIWTVPARKGSPRNLTSTSGIAERDPSWSPDGRWIAYFSDAPGEYELYITQSDGKGETRRLTTNGDTYRYHPIWSPDSKLIAFTDKTGAMHLHAIDSGETRQIDKDPWGSARRLDWSRDSRWLAYTKGEANRQTAIWLYNVEEGESHQVTSGMFVDTWPTFDRKGDYLFFATNRKFESPVHDDFGESFVFSNTDMLAVVPLRDEVGSPWAPVSDEETWAEEKEKEEGEGDSEDDETEVGTVESESDESTGQSPTGQPADDEKKELDPGDDGDGEEKDRDEDEGEAEEDAEEEKEKEEPIIIELEGFERRAIPLPVKKGGFYNLAVNDKGNLLYTRAPARGSDAEPSIKLFALPEKENGDEEGEEKTVLDGVGGFSLSADGKKLLVRKGPVAAIVDAAPDQKLDKPMSLSGMNVTIDPREEWRQMFHEAWRIQRDFFYDPNMHGVDWPAMRKHYGPMVEDCASRRDLDYVIGELIAELNVGHAYVWGGGDVEDGPEVSVGMLGVDFALNEGAYRLARIYEGSPWDLEARGPLSQPGVDVRQGDYLLAVNGAAMDTTKDPWAAFQGMAGSTVTLTVSDQPVRNDDAREVIVTLLDGEANLRYRAWIEHNRAYVEKRTDGRVGYVYVPDTASQGMSDFFRQYYGQVHKPALIVDERWNGGGHSPAPMVQAMSRPATNYWALRDGKAAPAPGDAHQGPKCMLINGMAGSGGDAFPYYFRRAKAGKLIGTRTWGGLVGISGNPALIDGGYITVPQFAFFETDGTWGVEGHGVDPDIEVIDDPALMVGGGDPQLDAAIEHLLEELKRDPHTPPKQPEYPDRSGMGVRQEDR